MLKRFLVAMMICLLTAATPLWAEEDAGGTTGEEQAQAANSADEFLKSLNFRQGIIDLPNGVAALNIPESFRYLGPDDTKRFLEEGWGNPDGSNQIGMLAPTDVDLFNDGAWVVVISYQEDGYVSDKDANDIDYNELLESMQKSSKESNKQRMELGYEPVTLIGWAAPPHYDGQAKKLYWAKELEFGDNPDHTLNYNVRILGRKGVLVMNAVSSMDQLPNVQERMEKVIAFAEFKDGHRYSDFNPGVDKVAAYGIAALIGGKVAAKVGLLAKLGGILLAFKKIFIIGFLAVAGFLAKLFRRGKPGAQES